MTQVIADKRDIEFVLYEQLEIGQFLKTKEFSMFNQKTFDMITREARKFALKEMLPTYKEADRNGAVFENGSVKSPECFHRLLKLYLENDWMALTQKPEYGGQGLPHMIAQVAWSISWQ